MTKIYVAMWRDMGLDNLKIPLRYKYSLISKVFDGYRSWLYVCCGVQMSDTLHLTHLPLVPHIYASVNRVSIGSDNGLSPIRHQAII